MKINVSFTAMTLIFVIKIYRTITNDYLKNHIFECFHYMFGFLKSGYICDQKCKKGRFVGFGRNRDFPLI